MEVIWIVLGVLYVIAIFTCFQKGKPVFGVLGISAITVVLAPIVVWFPIVGALRPAKPGSQWESDHRSPYSAATQSGAPFDTSVAGSAPPSPPAPASTRTGGSATTDEEARAISRFLMRAVDGGVLASATRDRLLDFLHAPAEPAAVPDLAPPTRPAAASPPRQPAAASRPVSAAPEAFRPVASPPAAPPPRAPRPVGGERPAAAQPVAKPPVAEPPLGPIAAWFKRAWDSVSAEIALHGFAYLGVLLTFVGVLGFLLFAFQDIDNSVQPFVELFVALVFFGWAWLLRRQEADNVANGMELLAGMILPLILFAGFVDGAPFPPNYTDGPLVAVLVITSLILAVVYALVARRRPTTMLRFLVVPLVWLAALALGLAFKTDERLMGIAITRFVAVQPALAAVAIAASVTPWARHRLAARAVPVVMPALVAAPLAYTLAVVLSAGQSGLMAFSASLAGIATIVSAYQLADHFNRPRPALLAMPVLLGGAVIPVAPSAGLGWAGVTAVAGYVLLIEWMASRTAPDRDGVLLAGAGLVFGLGLTFVEPLAAVVGFGSAALWLHWRRFTGLPVAGIDKAVVAGAAAVPFGFGWGLWMYADPATALIVFAALSCVVTLGARLLGSEDDFWIWWPAGTAAVTGILAAGVHVSQPATIAIPDGAVIATVALAAAAIGLGRDWMVVRLWLAGGFVVTDVFFILEALNATSSVAAVTWAGIGLALIATASLGRREAWDHVAVMGHVLASGALIVPAGSATGALVFALWSAGWLVSLIAWALERGCLSRLLVRSVRELPDEQPWATAIDWLVPSLFAASAPVAVLSSLNLWDTFVANRSWTGLVLATVAIVYAAATHTPASVGALRRVMATGAAATIVLGVAIAAPDSWPTIAAAAASIAVAFILAADVRQVAVSWFAWAMSGVMLTLLAERFGVLPHRLYLVVLAWGAVLFAGGLLADDALAGRREVGEGLRIGWTRFPVFLGALAVPVSLGPNFAASPTVAIWSAIAAAAAYGLVALLLRSPLPMLPAYGLAGYGIVLLADTPVSEEPMILVGLAAALVAAAVLTRIVVATGSSDVWGAWDLPPLLVAHVVATLALVVSIAPGDPAPWLTVAGLSAAVAVWRRNRLWLDGGHAIALVGAGIAGTGWLIVGLALTAGRAMLELRRLDGSARLVAHSVAVGSATAAWILLAIWSDWDLAIAVTATALAGGGTALIVGSLSRLELIRDDTAGVWAGWSVLGLIAASGTLVVEPAVVSTTGSHTAVACGVALLACAAQLLSSRFGRDLQLVSAPLAGLAWLAVATMPGADPATMVAASAVGFGVAGAVGAVLVATGVIRRDMGAAWMAVAMAGVGVAAGITFLSPDIVPTTGLRLATSVGLATLACAWHLLGRVFGDGARLAAVPLAGLSWLTTISAPIWAVAGAVNATALLGGVVAVAAVELRRAQSKDRTSAPVAWAWVTLGALLVVGAVLVTADMATAGLWASAVAPGSALLAWAAGRGAAPLGVFELRLLSAGTALGSVNALVYGLGGRFETLGAMALVLAVLGVAVLTRMGPIRDEPSVWLHPVELFTAAAFVEAGGMAYATFPDITALAAALLVAGLSAALLGVVRSSGWLMAASPPLLAGGTVLLISEIATGSVQWYTLPLGLAVLAEVEIARLMTRPEARMLDHNTLLSLEYGGIGLMVIPAIVELFVSSLAAGGVAFVVAVGLLLWSILTRVRRRAVSAAVVAVGTAVLMISAALAGNAPESAALWIIAAGLGFTVMSAAGVVEAARSKRGQAVRRIDELMGGWS